MDYIMATFFLLPFYAVGYSFYTRYFRRGVFMDTTDTIQAYTDSVRRRK